MENELPWLSSGRMKCRFVAFLLFFSTPFSLLRLCPPFFFRLSCLTSKARTCLRMEGLSGGSRGREKVTPTLTKGLRWKVSACLSVAGARGVTTSRSNPGASPWRGAAGPAWAVGGCASRRGAGASIRRLAGEQSGWEGGGPLPPRDAHLSSPRTGCDPGQRWLVSAICLGGALLLELVWKKPCL